jgi:hypothetical protein
MAGVMIAGMSMLPGPAGTAASPASKVAVIAADTDQRLIELWLYGRAKRTQRAYQADIAAFNRFVQKPLRQLTLGELQSYQDSLQHLATASQAPAQLDQVTAQLRPENRLPDAQRWGRDLPAKDQTDARRTHPGRG